MWEMWLVCGGPGSDACTYHPPVQSFPVDHPAESTSEPSQAPGQKSALERYTWEAFLADAGCISETKGDSKTQSL